MSDKNEIVAIAKLTRADVERVGSSLKLVFKAEHSQHFDELLRALDATAATPCEKAR